jgi:hypothetical protein
MFGSGESLPYHIVQIEVLPLEADLASYELQIDLLGVWGLQPDTQQAPVVPHPPSGTPRQCDRVCNAAQVAEASPGLEGMTPHLQLLYRLSGAKLMTSRPGMPRAHQLQIPLCVLP